MSEPYDAPVDAKDPEQADAAAAMEGALQQRYEDDLLELLSMPSRAFLRVLDGWMTATAQRDAFDTSNPYLLSEMAGRYNVGVELRLLLERLSPGVIQRAADAAREAPPPALGDRKRPQEADRGEGPASA